MTYRDRNTFTANNDEKKNKLKCGTLFNISTGKQKLSIDVNNSQSSKLWCKTILKNDKTFLLFEIPNTENNT